MIVAANWKMGPSLQTAGVLAGAVAARDFPEVQRMLFVPHPFLMPMSVELASSGVRLGGQDCHFYDSGAFTGDVAASMLRDCGASVVLVGHSERRAAYGETSDTVAKKAAAAFAQGLDVVVCVGETKMEREEGNAEQVVIDQIRASVPCSLPAQKLLIAYEPVWSIGTGVVPSLSDIALMHQVIAGVLAEKFVASLVPPILFGGSVNSDNAGAIFSVPKVGGVLVGGASLDAEVFSAICLIASQCFETDQDM